MTNTELNQKRDYAANTLYASGDYLLLALSKLPNPHFKKDVAQYYQTKKDYGQASLPYPNDKLLSQRDLYLGLKDHDYDSLNQMSGKFEDLPKLKIPKLTAGLQDGSVTKQAWQTAIDETMNDVKEAVTDGRDNRHRSIKRPIGMLNFTDPNFPITAIHTNENVLNAKASDDVDADFIAFFQYQGDPRAFNQGQELTTGIIGSREMSPGSKSLAQNTGQYLTANGVNVLSGLAEGCDQAAHQGLVAAYKNAEQKGVDTSNYGKGIIVLGEGLNTSLYPFADYKNKDYHTLNLANDVLKYGGVVVSQFDMNEGLKGFRLVARDKVQAQLVDGMMAVECGEHLATNKKTGHQFYKPSGTIHATRDTIRQHRPLLMPDSRYFLAKQNSKYQGFNEPVPHRYRYNDEMIRNGQATAFQGNTHELNAFVHMMKENQKVRNTVLHTKKAKHKANETDGPEI